MESKSSIKGEEETKRRSPSNIPPTSASSSSPSSHARIEILAAPEIEREERRRGRPRSLLLAAAAAGGAGAAAADDDDDRRSSRSVSDPIRLRARAPGPIGGGSRPDLVRIAARGGRIWYGSRVILRRGGGGGGGSALGVLLRGLCGGVGAAPDRGVAFSSDLADVRPARAGACVFVVALWISRGFVRICYGWLVSIGLAFVDCRGRRGGEDAMEADSGKLFVGGISWETDEDRLREYFSRFGEVTEAVIMRDRNTGRARGFGFVVFTDAGVAERVTMDKHMIDGRMVNHVVT